MEPRRLDRLRHRHATSARSRARHAPELVADPVHRMLNRLHVYPNIFVGLALFAWGGWSFVVWGIFLRLVVGLHATWFVNSAAHTFGYRTYDTPEGSTNCWWVGLIAWGEGWHNNHHAFQRSARHGHEWWELDLTWAAIRGLRSCGLATRSSGLPARGRPVPARPVRPRSARRGPGRPCGVRGARRRRRGRDLPTPAHRARTGSPVFVRPATSESRPSLISSTAIAPGVSPPIPGPGGMPRSRSLQTPRRRRGSDSSSSSPGC